MTDEELSISDATLIARWDDYVESMGSVMGEVEHMAQQMRDRIEVLVKERDKAALWATEQHACADNYALRLGQEKARAEQLVATNERLEAALRVARVHVANNAEGWGVSRGASRDDLTLVDAALEELKGN